MMKKQIAAAILALSATGGIGTGFALHSWNDDNPQASKPTVTTPTPTKPTTTKTSTPAPTKKPAPNPTKAPTLKVADFILAPGVVGPVKVGMTKKQALATGLFDADVTNEACVGYTWPLRWKSAYDRAFDVQTPGNGEIISVGVRSPAARTQSGLGVGSTYGEVRAAIDDAQAQEAGYSQSGVLNYDPINGGWIGFLFDASVDQLKDSDKATFVEITKGSQPDLMRDGC